MDFPRKDRSGEGGDGEDLDRGDGVRDEGEGSEGIDRSRPSGSGRASGGLLQRLTDALREGGNGDLVLERGEVENGMLQWLRALDLQVMGACRADERLKPLIKFNVPGGIAENRLISQLSQHFEVTEVGTLARCLCVPLVSVRVGRTNKEGNLICATNTRGFLQLNLLPSSDMRLSFHGDDGVNEKLVTVSHLTENSDVMIEEISADSTRRSFLIRLPDNRKSYFWCSEKSTLIGSELLAKMEDLLQRRPSLSQLTGISQLRLDAFATHLRTYLLRSSNTVEAKSGADSGRQPSCTVSGSSCSWLSTSQPVKPHPPYQSSLNLRSNKDGLVKNLLSMRNVTRPKLRQHGENNFSPPVAISPPVKISTSCTSCASSTSQGDDKLLECSTSIHVPPFFSPEVSSLSCLSPSLGITPSQVPAMSSSPFSPYYCWCPPYVSSCQNIMSPSQVPSMASEPLLLPPLSSVLSNVGSSVPFGISKAAIDLSDVSALDLPSIFPLPSSFVSMAGTQQIPTFTPFMSDPIVHIPVIDVCSSGQGYLVSAGPAISTAVPPLFPSIASPLIPEDESPAQKNARETIRILMASAPASPQLMKVLPAVLTSVSEDLSCIHGVNHGALVAGSRGLYSGTKDVDAATKCVVSTGIPSSAPPNIAVADQNLKEMPSHTSEDDMEDLVSEGYSCADEGETSSY